MCKTSRIRSGAKYPLLEGEFPRAQGLSLSVAARYVNSELLTVFAVTLLVLLLVAVGGRFVGYLQDAVAGKYAADAVLTIIGLRMPEFLQLVLPFAFFVAILLTLGRLHAENEMVVLQGGGMSTRRLLIWLSGASLTLAAIVGVLALEVTPRANEALGEFFLEQRSRQEFQNITPGMFNSNARATRVIYTESVSDDRARLQRVFLWERLPDGRDATTWADTGRQFVDTFTGSQFLVLDDGVRYEGLPGNAEYRLVDFAELSQRIARQRSGSNRVGISGVVTSELPGTLEGIGEWHWRVAVPVYLLVSVLLAVGIARVKPRAGRFAKVMPGLGLLLAYYLSLLGNHHAIVEAMVPAALGLWPVHAAFALLAWFLLRRLGRPVSG